MERKTPLYDQHVTAGGRMVPFGGYLLPVQYGTGILKEHMAVRTAAGLFDVSHMAELSLRGPDSEAALQNLVTADLSKMADGQVKYAMFLNERGGVVDDLVVCRIGPEDYLLVVNAGNHAKDAAWVESHLIGEVRFADISDHYAQIALQGPKSHEILSRICREEFIPEKYYHFVADGKLAACGRTVDALISRTGYTGELGYEVYCAPEDAGDVWDVLLEAGAGFGLIPCGLGARDTLRLEAGMPLYGHELSDEISPLEACLPCRLDRKDFIGRDALAARGAPQIRRVGIEAVGRVIPREDCAILDESGTKIGRITSGTFCPYLGKGLAMGYIPADVPAEGARLFLDIRGRTVEAVTAKLPFYSNSR